MVIINVKESDYTLGNMITFDKMYKIFHLVDNGYFIKI